MLGYAEADPLIFAFADAVDQSVAWDLCEECGWAFPHYEFLWGFTPAWARLTYSVSRFYTTSQGSGGTWCDDVRSGSDCESHSTHKSWAMRSVLREVGDGVL